tara:strand:+ start:481 stop:885 length:405 start_codon:yes stop_codon:yes gene_type:complete
MANIRFHNDTKALNHLWYESHKNLLTSLCIEFGKTDQIDDMVKKFLCEPVKMKALKDPNKPKRAKSAYLFYCDDHRQKILDTMRKKKKKVNIADVSKQLGAKWKGLSDAAKAPYEAKAQADRERYQEEMEQYTA